MDIEIICPVCSFSKAVSMDKIPDGVKWVICPGCKSRFEFTNAEPDVEQETASPWERRMELGLWQGIFRTFLAVLFSPGRFYKRTGSISGIREPLSFGILMGSLGYMIGFFWKALLISAGIMSYSSDFFSRIPVNLLFLGGMILAPVLVILHLFISGAIIHLLMLAFNAGRGGFQGTFRSIAFGEATKILSFIPFIGGMLGWFWNIVVIIIGLRETHETSTSRAAAAVIIYVLLYAGFILMTVFLLKSLFEALVLLQ